MRKRYKMGLILIIILILILIFFGLFKLFKPTNNNLKNTTSIIKDIKEYGYSLDDRDSKYMKEEFNNLTKILQESEINYLEYAKSIAKLFIIDFYTLNNKINKYDIGGVDYIYKEKQDDFKNKARDTIYNNIIDNTYLDRVQELPEVVEVIINNVEESNLEYKDNTYEGYIITLNINYKEDLGYDNEGTITLIKNNNKLEIIKYEPIINN